MPRDESEGIAPIVVEILQRKPLPALDKDAVIIKRKKQHVATTMTKGRGKPDRPQPHVGMRRHAVLHSHKIEIVLFEVP